MIKDVVKAGEASAFPGTEREVTISIPGDSTRQTRALVIDIFIKPGVVPDAKEKARPRYNLSYE